jgi:hypothetical protein
VGRVSVQPKRRPEMPAERVRSQRKGVGWLSEDSVGAGERLRRSLSSGVLGSLERMRGVFAGSAGIARVRRC